MAGVILVILGVAKLGRAIKFIPTPVVVGFTSGIAVIIFSSQVKDFLGLQMGDLPAEFIPKWRAIASHLGSADGLTLGVGIVALLVMTLASRGSHGIPSPFVALIATTLGVRLLHIPVETIGTKFGVISATFP